MQAVEQGQEAIRSFKCFVKFHLVAAWMSYIRLVRQSIGMVRERGRGKEKEGGGVGRERWRFSRGFSQRGAHLHEGDGDESVLYFARCNCHAVGIRGAQGVAWNESLYMDAPRRRALIVMPQVLILLDLLVQKYKY